MSVPFVDAPSASVNNEAAAVDVIKLMITREIVGTSIPTCNSETVRCNSDAYFSFFK